MLAVSRALCVTFELDPDPEEPIHLRGWWVIADYDMWFGPSIDMAEGAEEESPTYLSTHWLRFTELHHEARARRHFELLKVLNVPMVLTFDMDTILERFESRPIPLPTRTALRRHN